jgi:DNA-binding NtrC family response regulator
MRTILVVDDEELVCKLACAVLTACGYRVLTALNTQAARSLLQESTGKISLVLLDEGLSEFLPNIDPNVVVLLSSGSLPRNPAPISCFLQKPYSAARLREAVNLALQPHHLAA